MPSFSDSIFLFVLALLLFGPKKLPVLARELGKWVGEFRRASNEFKMQMEEEMRAIEREERDKKVAAIEAAAPTPALASSSEPQPDIPEPGSTETTPTEPSSLETEASTEPLPIATSGELSILPPATGLPTPRASSSPLGGLLDHIPNMDDTKNATAEPTDTATHA